MLRDFLLASGLDPKDLADAVRESRRLVRGIERWSGLATRAAAHVAQKAKPGVVQKGAVIATVVSDTVNEKAGVLLGRTRGRGSK